MLKTFINSVVRNKLIVRKFFVSKQHRNNFTTFLWFIWGSITRFNLLDCLRVFLIVSILLTLTNSKEKCTNDYCEIIELWQLKIPWSVKQIILSNSLIGYIIVFSQINHNVMKVIGMLFRDKSSLTCLWIHFQWYYLWKKNLKMSPAAQLSALT